MKFCHASRPATVGAPGRARVTGPAEAGVNTGGFQSLGVTIADDGRTVLLEFHHGKANEVGTEQLTELETLVQRLRAAPEVSTLITTSRRRSSRGTPIFISGANVTERVGWSNDRVKEHVRWQRKVLFELRHAPVFHVVVVEGLALGWGCEFLITADYRIGCDNAELGLPETGLGILPGAGGTSELWAQIGLNQALRLGMTGERIGADEAYRIGLVDERASTIDAGLERASALARMVARRSPTAVAQFKQTVLASVGEEEEVRQELEARAYERCVDYGEAAIGRASFDLVREGRIPEWGPRRSGKR
jgi:enoyl-CoA hydratase/carnithine racemase